MNGGRDVNLSPDCVTSGPSLFDPRPESSAQGVLTKLSTAKELMKEIMERERKKQSERDAEKAKKTEGKVDGCAHAAAADLAAHPPDCRFRKILTQLTPAAAVLA